MTKLGGYYPNKDKIIIRKKRIKRYFKPCVSRALFIVRFHEWIHRIQWYLIRDADKWNILMRKGELEKQAYFFQHVAEDLLFVRI